MGRLVGLELHNFKSYRGTASIGFGSANFTSIIGPNGSGKSNMMDAISFVLGVKSQHLRSNQLKDLIYRGRLLDGDIEQLQDGELDNEDLDSETAYVMAIYEKSDGEILQLKRTIGSRGQSEYRINNKVTSAGEYSNVLKKENILIKARNFLVFQGDVEQIASQSAAELSKLLETVSGSLEYKREYESLKDEQDQAKEDTAAILSKRRTLISELKQYKEQRHEAEEFKSKLHEKNNLTKLLTLWNLYHIELKRDNLTDEFKESKKKLKELKNDIHKAEKEFQSVKAEYAKESLKLNKFHKKIDSQKSDINSKKQELLPINAQQDVINKTISKFNKRVKDLSSDFERQQEYVQGVERQIKVVTKAKSNAEKEFNAKHSNSNITLEDQQEYENLKQQYLSQGGASEEEQLNLLNVEKNEIKAILASISNQRTNADVRVEELKSQHSKLSNDLTTVSTELNELNELYNQRKIELKNLNIENENFLSKEYELNSRLRETLISLEELNANQRETNKERKLRENVNTLRRLFPGVKGLLSDLCQPKQKKYENAISTILGKNFDSVIVENSAIAHQCITYLKEQRSGVASFIPLDTIDAKPIDSRLRQLDPRARPSIDIIDYDPVLERAMQFACGNSMVCDDLRLAKEIRWGKKIDVKVVTLDGSLIHKAGLMTGGRAKNQERRWNKTEVQNLTRLKDDLSYELNQLQERRPDHMKIRNLDYELGNLDLQIVNVRRKRVELERSILDVDAEMKYYNNSNESEKRRQQEEDKLNDVNKRILEQENNIQLLKKDIFKKFCSKLGFKDIKEYENSSGSEIREQSKELNQYQNELYKLGKKLDFEKERFNETSNRITKIEAEKSSYEKSLTQLIKEKELTNDQIDRLESELEITTQELLDFEKSIEDKLQKSKNSEDNLHDLQYNYESFKKSLEIQQQDIERYTIERISFLKNCKIENINIPLKQGSSLDDLPIDNTEEIFAIADEISIDFSTLSTRYKENDNEIISNEITEKLSDITKELETLSPNTKALERLTEVEKRMEEIEKELHKTRSQELVIVKKFQEVKNKRYELFISAFNHISEKIDPIYKELTKANNTTLGGGAAYLTLEDEDEPYLAGIRYHAMPPMKRFKDMEFLSGGEKTIAALALLFAIHSFHPSPFFVLDEVDAALDNNNVQKIANYITKNSGPNFQFIVISLKNGLFEKSDALVGIYREQRENSSKTLTLDLRNYPETA
ncbi:Structural maintenance of chromosomes protein [Wickerhamomyces ciferrii]|uniref:Structural maintenance of chromosomes protein n=1 Tax=Wickerhamomyces ciferrii (strain ATCC 14091 / BCRC 22168 / CBS 111 / JCM 3599 / NBRC 0793 / NRRL Y-1031 F-60-10) TaxID=1206466 RepID=K0KFW6_WICCF|nr:Structural maintenance of chromosomes protein [Wickerhamomyces ciferrii]CCH41801.1 Structural maintenance of chromosomes protein [Wickerhamomyces ciferrii]